MDGLTTTNTMLGIIAGVSVLQALLALGVGFGAYRAYSRVMTLMNDLEARQVAPAMARVNAILDDVKEVSSTVKEETVRVDTAIRTTMDRMDDTADRVRTNVRAKTSRIVGVVRGARVAVEHMLSSAA